MTISKEFGVALLDTNILDYAFKSRTKVAASNLLGEIAKRYTPVISEYLRFEIYRGLNMDRIPAAKAVVDAFTAYSVDKGVLDTAAALTTCYQVDKSTQTKRGGLSDGDIIMASTAFVNKFVLVTANRMDFPAPYFEEIKAYAMSDMKKKPIVFYELRPNILYLNAMLEICYPSKLS